MKQLFQILVAAIATAIGSASVSLLLAFALLHAGNAASFAVVSDSMAPLMQRGDLVVTTAHGDLAVGDAVTFRKFDQLVTHRIDGYGRQPGTYETRGDANPSRDTWTITAKDVVGKVQGVVRNAGWPLLWLSTAIGRLLVCAVLLLSLFGMHWAFPKVLYTQAVP